MKRQLVRNLFLSCSIALAFLSTESLAVELSGKFTLEGTIYTDEGQFAQQDYRSALSIAAEPEFYWDWNLSLIHI